MEWITKIIEFFQSPQVLGWVAALWLLEQAIRAISVLTPWKWDDNLVEILAKALKTLFPGQAPKT